MCAKKKANLDFWLTIWLSFERRKIFLETILQMLLICVCHFSYSSTVTPSRRCFETCSIGVVSNFRFKGTDPRRFSNFILFIYLFLFIFGGGGGGGGHELLFYVRLLISALVLLK